jgi:hypothetical protein
MRSLVVREDYVVDFFQVQSDQPHDYSWVLHVDGQPSTRSLTNWAVTTFPTQAPWSYLLNPQRASSAGSYRESFTRDGRTMRVNLQASGPIEVVQCGFPADDSPHPVPLPMRLVQCRQAEAWFAAVYRLEPERGGDVELQVQPSGAGQVEIRLRHPAGERRHRVPDIRAARR